MKQFLLLPFLAFCTVQVSGQVNVQQGSAQFDLPIFNFSDAKSGLGHSVTLSYSSGSGLRVNSKGSDIGEGWELKAGGSIIRTQNGEPDDQNSTGQFPPILYNATNGYHQTVGYYEQIGALNDGPSYPVICTPAEYVNNYYPNGFLYSEFPYDMTDATPLKWAAPKETAFMPRFRSNMDNRWKLSRRALTDRQQDIFLLNINGRIVEFVIGKNGTIACLQNSKLQIVPTYNTGAQWMATMRTTISSFTVTDENGIVYEFAQPDYSEVLKQTTIDNGSGSFALSQTAEEGEGKYTIDKWSLTSITNPFTGEQITFIYQDIQNAHLGKGTDFVSQLIPSYDQLENNAFQNVNLHKARIKGKRYRLLEIDFPNKYSLYLNYLINTKSGLVLRQDVEGEPILGDIVIKNNADVLFNTQFVAKYEFKQGYFYKKQVVDIDVTVPPADTRYLRMCLRSVQKSGMIVSNIAEEPPYQFTYYTGSESPDQKDIVPPVDCFAQDHWGYYNKSSIVDISQAVPAKEILKSLMVNAALYRSPNALAPAFGLLRSVKNPAKGELTYEYVENKQDVTTGGVTSPVLTGGVHVNFVKQYDGIDHNNDIMTRYNYVVENGGSSLWGYEAPVYNLRREMTIAKNPPGYTKGGVMSSGRTGALGRSIIVGSIKAMLKTFMKLYAQFTGTASLAASCFIGAYVFVIGKMIEGIFAIADPFDTEYDNNYQFYPLNYANALGNHFSRVEISNTSLAGGTGKIVQEFSKPANIAAEISANNFPYSNKQRYVAWEFDQLKKEKIYDNTARLISENTYNYNIIKDVATLNTIDFKSCKVEPNHLFSSHYEDNLDHQSISNWSYEFYTPVTGRAELLSSNSKSYSYKGVTAETNASIAYNSNYLPKTSTVEKSNGDKIVTKTYYVTDYDDAVRPAIALLKSKKAITVPVSTETWLIKAGSQAEYLVDASINEYSIVNGTDVKLTRVYGLETKQPIPYASILYQSSNQLLRSSLFVLQKELIYDTNGNMVETRAKGGEVSASMYDYENRMQVAAISNAHYTDVAYTSFEAGNKGRWIYDQAGVAGWDSYGITGALSFDITNRSISTGVPMSKNYILSFWSNHAVTVAGSAVLTKTGPVAGNWTYYEYTISQGSASPVITGPMNTYIDELRLYPADAKMSTTTYDLISGKPRSQCDVNNNVQYYEYDPLGRLAKVKDRNRNLLKTYEYHFKN